MKSEITFISVTVPQMSYENFYQFYTSKEVVFNLIDLMILIEVNSFSKHLKHKYLIKHFFKSVKFRDSILKICFSPEDCE